MKKNPFKAIFENTEQKTNDVLGAYPEAVHVRALPERRYLKTTRVLTIISIISLSVTMLFASIIYVLAPQKTASVVLTTKDNQITGLKNVEPSEVRVGAMSLYFEKIVSDYVVMRHEVKSDTDILKERFENKNSRVNMLSVPAEQAKMLAEEKLTVPRITNDGLTRKVNVVWVKRLTKEDSLGGLFLVHFETLDFHYNKPDSSIKEWESLIRIGRRSVARQIDAASSEEDKAHYIAMVENNPLNVKVTNYVLSYVGDRATPMPAKKKIANK